MFRLVLDAHHLLITCLGLALAVVQDLIIAYRSVLG